MMLLSGVTSDTAKSYIAQTADLAIFGAASVMATRARRPASRRLDASKNAKSTLKIYTGTEHGVPMFTKNAELQPMIVGWLKARLAGQAPVAKTWTAPRTPWGDPDIAGVFTTDDEMGVPFERPAQFGDRQFVTDAEFSQRQTQIQRQTDADREEFVVARPAAAEGPTAGGTGPPAHWIERGKPSRRTSFVIDPADGRIPYLSEEGRGGASATPSTADGGQAIPSRS